MAEQRKIRVPFSESDIQDLQAGEEFVWTFPDQYGDDIEVHIVQETQDDEEGDEIGCLIPQE